jgi:glyoxylase-like metal-dependent hydrolase (beta-lactamase superfamily II)
MTSPQPAIAAARPEDWYATERVGDAVTLISEPFVKPYYRCNIWHVRGRDRDLLVDSGMGVVSLRAWVPLAAEWPLLAVASHTHFDHIGAHHEFTERAEHAAEADLLSRPARETTLAEAYVRDDIYARLPPAPYSSARYAVAPAPPTRILADGDVVDLGDRAFTVLHTPGHSPGGITLFEAATGILFARDIVYDGPLADDLYHSDVADYIASMRRFYELPVGVVHAGHFPSFDGNRYRTLIRTWLDSKEAE